MSARCTQHVIPDSVARFIGHLVRDPSFGAESGRQTRATANAGGGPAAAHFLCFAKESTQRKATRLRQSFGLPCAARRVRRLRNSPSLGAQTAPRPVLEQCSPNTPTAPVLLGSAERGWPFATITLCIVVAIFLLAGCSSTPKKPSSSPSAPTTPSKPGGFYQDDGPGADAKRNNPEYLDSIPDAVPREERYHSGANRPYSVFGRSYVPVINNDPFRQTGIASWYGRKFHGNMTSIGEIYDMYAMTAAHPTLPLPAYVRVTNPANQRSVVVRVNDRGPFHSDRIIDLSYAAAYRIGITQRGSAPVIVERVFAGDRAPSRPTTTATTPATTAPTTAASTALATALPPPTPQVTVSPITADGKDLFLQLGAFGSQENANIFRDRMARELDWNREPLIVLFRDGLWRVRMGPYTSRLEAEAIQARVKESHDFSPVISSK